MDTSEDDNDGSLQPSKPRRTAREPPTPSTLLKITADRILDFLSNANNETLGACLLGLSVTTYLILGRVGLILIGVAGGIILHATWESKGQNGKITGGEIVRRKEVGIDVAKRVLDWRRKRDTSKEDVAEHIDVTESHLKSLDFSDFRPETATALNTLTDAIVGDYVKWWYSPILPQDQSFPSSCRRVFASFLLAFSSHLSGKRVADLFLEFATNSSSVMIVFLNELSTALTEPLSTPAAETIQTYIRLNPQSSLANLLDQKLQKSKLLIVADDVLESYLDSNVYSCSPVRIFLREVLANLIFDATLQRCSKSEWLNDWIVYLLEEGEPELLNVIDVGVENSNIKHPNVTRSQNSLDSSRPSNEDLSRNNSGPNHKRNLSRAEEAMEEAMREAQRLTQLMAEEDARLAKEKESAGVALGDDASDSPNTHGVQTPASSRSDLHSEIEQPSSHVNNNSANVSFEVARSEAITSSPTEESATFTNFDQIVRSTAPTALADSSATEHRRESQNETLTLCKANISIFDTSDASDRRPLKTKPTEDYMIQIEPVSSSFRGFRGWMIARTYTDFETLHEILRRISAVSGTVLFTERHAYLPSWKGLTKAQLASELERYLGDAVQSEPLAESEGMRRFLDKDQGGPKPTGPKNTFWSGPAALETMGKGMFDVLTKAPKEVMSGGKTVLGGMTNVLTTGSIAPRKPAISPAPRNRIPLPANPVNTQAANPALSRSTTSSMELPRDSLSLPEPRTSALITGLPRSRSPASTSPRESRPPGELQRQLSSASSRGMVRRQSSSTDGRRSVHDLRPGETQNLPLHSTTPSPPPTPQLKLPPPPLDIPDDYVSPSLRSSPAVQNTEFHMSADGTSFFDVSTLDTFDADASKSMPTSNAQISEQEAQVAVELFFAVTNELYTLSSAWNIRRTLLNAAKAYLLRPGNPQLEKIRVLLQESILDANSSDAGIAAHIRKIRETGLPTEDELKKWPPERTTQEKEALRKRARKLLVDRGMPQALTSVMGAAASGEALGKVFDFLQIEEVARGLMFGVLLQAIRATTQ